MMDKYGVKSTHDAIKGKLLDYINTVYLGKNDALPYADTEVFRALRIQSYRFQFKSKRGLIKQELHHKSDQNRDHDPQRDLAVDSADLYIRPGQAGSGRTDVARPRHDVHEVIVDKEPCQVADDIVDHDR